MRIPIPIKVEISEELPLLISGSGTPVAGSDPVAVAIFISA